MEIEQILIKCKKISAIPITTRKDFVKIPESLKKRFSVIDINVEFNKRSFTEKEYKISSEPDDIPKDKVA